MSKPTNRFAARVAIDFPHDISKNALIEWFNSHYTDKNSNVYKDNLKKLLKTKEFHFVFEIDKEGNWKYIGRKD